MRMEGGTPTPGLWSGGMNECCVSASGRDGGGKGGGREEVGPGGQGRSREAAGDPVAGPETVVNTRSQGTRQAPRLALNALGAPQGSAAESWSPCTLGAPEPTAQPAVLPEADAESGVCEPWP